MTCFDSLPNEVLIIISESFPSSSTPTLRSGQLAVLARISRRLYQLFNPILYRCNRDESNSSAVLWAAQNGQIGTLEKALTFRLDLDPQVSETFTYYYESIPNPSYSYEIYFAQSSIFRAIQNGHEASVAWLVDHGVEMDFPSKPGIRGANVASSALFASLALKQTLVACLLIEKGACLEFLSEGILTYGEAIRRGRADIEPTNEEPTDEQPSEGDPRALKYILALHFAAESGLVSVVKSLVRGGIDINTTDHKGDICLHYAARRAREDSPIIRELIQLGADVNWYGSSSPLCDAIDAGNLTHALTLIDAGSRIDRLSPSGLAPIHLCTRSEPLNGERFYLRYTLLQKLIDLSVDLNGKDLEGQTRTPLGEAILSGSDWAVEMLVKAGADVEQDTGNGYSPICTAWNKFLIDTDDQASLTKMKILLRYGARIDSQFKDNKKSLLQVVAEWFEEEGIRTWDGDAQCYKPELVPLYSILEFASARTVTSEHMDEVLAISASNRSYESCIVLQRYGAKLRNGFEDVVDWAEGMIRDKRYPRYVQFSASQIIPDFSEAYFEQQMMMFLDFGLRFEDMDRLLRRALRYRDNVAAMMILNRDITGRSPGHDPNIWLQQAASWGNTGVLRNLLNGSPDVNGFDSEGDLPLSKTVRAGNRYATMLLLEYGADPYLTTTIHKGQMTKQTIAPIQYAVWSGRLDVLMDIIDVYPGVPSEEEIWVPAVLKLAPEITKLLEQGHSSQELWNLVSRDEVHITAIHEGCEDTWTVSKARNFLPYKHWLHDSSLPTDIAL